MTPIEHIEQSAKAVNAKLEQQIADATDFPMIVSSRVLYHREIGPIELGYEDAYLNGDFDDILHQYQTEISDKFSKHFQDLGLIPKETLQEFMGKEFEDEPKRTKHDLEESAIYLSKNLAAITKKFTTGDLKQVPESLKEQALATEQKKLEEIITMLKEGDYIVTQKEKDYANAYHERYGQYMSMWKI